jgi:parallel beta-helix repeat protein
LSKAIIRLVLDAVIKHARVIPITLSILLALSICVYPVPAQKLMSITLNEFIQCAINGAQEGDTVKVPSGIYYGSIIVNKSIILVGENAETTIIDGNGTDNFIVLINANNTLVDGFTIRNTGSKGPGVAIQICKTRNVIIRNVVVTKAYFGIMLTGSNNTEISNNEISENYFSGIYLHQGSCNNKVADNTIKNNPTGIMIADETCQFNSVYHNNLINNTNQVTLFGLYNRLDSGYPSGGNYWSDYNSTDLYNGCYQNETGSDGILDEPYPDRFSKWDNFPLKSPLHGVNLKWQEKLFRIDIITNSTTTSLNFSQEFKLLSLKIIGPNGTIGFCRVTIPKQLLSCESPSQWNVSAITNQGVYAMPYLALNDENNAYLYFCYDHSAIKEVEIEGTEVIPELSSATMILFMIASLVLLLLKKLIPKITLNIKYKPFK